MIPSFSIILENDILFCSDDKKYNAFEIILFTEKLLRSINPGNTWRLKKICLKHKKFGKERIIVEHIVTKAGQNLFFCSIGTFSVGSIESFKMLKDFSRQVQVQYAELDRLKFSAEEPTFKDVIQLITDYLKDKYLDPLEEEIIYEKTINNGKNAILYAGISTQGLPLVSQLFDISLLSYLDKTNENIELFSSDLSAKLATISMNTQIRVKTKIKEIHIEDTQSNEENNKKIILFGTINGYSVDFIATGNFYKVKAIFKQFKSKMALDSAFNEEFSGDLRPFKHLMWYLDEVVKEFD